MQIHELFVLGGKHMIQAIIYTQVFPGGMFSNLGGHSIGHSKPKRCICTCPIPNGFRDFTVQFQNC